MLSIHKLDEIKSSLREAASKISTETLGWLAIIVLHSATIPTLMAVMTGLSDKMPPIDLVLLLWSGLVLLFVKAAIQKDILNLVTIGLGFVVQSVMVALIFFK
jgi:hypothetical protein